MDDKQIVELYWARCENAIAETADKYGRYCRYIAYNILRNAEDSEECVNDTYMKAWGIIPPQRPNALSAFLGRITRNLSIDRYRRYTAEKRGAGQIALALEELEGSLSAADSVEQTVDGMALTELLNLFLESLSPESRKLFMRRYWYFSSIKEIAADCRMSESKVKMSLLRSRNELKCYLDKEGVSL